MGMDTGSDLKLYEGEFDEAGLEISNPLAFSERPDSIAVSRPFADRYGLKDGDQFPVYTQRGPTEFHGARFLQDHRRQCGLWGQHCA